jgi:UDP-N-acetylglucosamine:LPS N-acetylglucosamine transferase
MGVAPEKVAVTGIPLDEKFIVPRDRKEVRRKLGVQENVFTVLVSTSSFGFGPIEELARGLKDIQLLIISGNNARLKAALEAQKNPKHKVYGFVDNMPELMAAADVMITKPGGLSVTEGLACGLPLIFFSAIPGQEAGNVRVLAANGVGISDKSLEEIVIAIKEYAASPGKLAAARDASLKLARPRSVEDIIRRL